MQGHPSRRTVAKGGIALGLTLAGVPGLRTPAVQAAPSTTEAMQGRGNAQQALTVAAFPAIDDIVRAAQPAWQQRFPNVALKVVSRQAADHHTAMTTALSTASSLPDVMALEIDYLGRFAQGSGLEDLSREPYAIGKLQSHYVPYALAQARNARGEIVAAPTDIGPGTLLYRHDLLAKAGVNEAALTGSWEGFVEAGRKIKAATGGYLMAHARDMKDILIRTGIQPGEGLYFDKQSRTLVTSPRFVRAFTLARAVRQHKLDARVNAWSSDWIEGFKRGGIATQMSGAWLAGHLNNWLAPETRGLWRAAQLPEGAYAAYGGTFFAIPRGAAAERKPLAWQFLQLITLNRELQLAAFKSHDAFPALVDSFDDPFFEQPLPFLGGQPGRAIWRDAARHIAAVDVHKQDPFANEVVNTELDKVLLRGKDIGSALGDAERLLQSRAKR